jgi:hypothetical protein
VLSSDAASLVATLIEGYAAAGLAFAALFLPCGAARVDPLVGRSPWTVRLLLAPGVVALWPMLAVLWRRSAARTAGAAEIPS